MPFHFGGTHRASVQTHNFALDISWQGRPGNDCETFSLLTFGRVCSADDVSDIELRHTDIGKLHHKLRSDGGEGTSVKSPDSVSSRSGTTLVAPRNRGPSLLSKEIKGKGEHVTELSSL